MFKHCIEFVVRKHSWWNKLMIKLFQENIINIHARASLICIVFYFNLIFITPPPIINLWAENIYFMISRYMIQIVYMVLRKIRSSSRTGGVILISSSHINSTPKRLRLKTVLDKCSKIFMRKQNREIEHLLLTINKIALELLRTITVKLQNQNGDESQEWKCCFVFYHTQTITRLLYRDMTVMSI
jgi:hypothetical protein